MSRSDIVATVAGYRLWRRRSLIANFLRIHEGLGPVPIRWPFVPLVESCSGEMRTIARRQRRCYNLGTFFRRSHIA